MPNGNTAGIDNSKRVALVIGSGGVKCAAALGLQNVLMREGIAIDTMVGCSGGSIYAALIAAGYDAATVIDMNTRLWTRDLTRNVIRRRCWRPSCRNSSALMRNSA